jgi:hypothetical protein
MQALSYVTLLHTLPTRNCYLVGSTPEHRQAICTVLSQEIVVDGGISATIQISALPSEYEGWHVALGNAIASGFNVSIPQFDDEKLGPIAQLKLALKYIQQAIFTHTQKYGFATVFLNELEWLPKSVSSEFICALRAIQEERNFGPHRLTFCILGAQPPDYYLMTNDPPFNNALGMHILPQ